jgi:anhydro-N-acetylmuramic acid kinase
MSGTSLDGIDVALVKTDGEDEVHRGPARTYAYEPDQRAMLREAIAEAAQLTDRRARPGSLAAIEWSLSEWHARAVQSFCEDTGITANEIDVIGFHGQTVIHRPEIGLTVQLGDGALLARRTGKPVVHDMRAADGRRVVKRRWCRSITRRWRRSWPSGPWPSSISAASPI